MRKHGGTPSRRDKHVTLAAISPPGVARGRFVGGQQSGLAGSKPPPLFTREASSCSSQGRRQGEPWGASPRPSAPTYLPPPPPAPLVLELACVPAVDPMRPTGGSIFFERTSVFERRVESSNEDSNSKIVFALIAIQLNPIESKLLGRIAAKAQQQQRANQIDRRLTQICARKTQIGARKTQICARKKGSFCFFN